MVYFICEATNGKTYDFNKECNKVKIEHDVWYFRNEDLSNFYTLAMMPSSEVHRVYRETDDKED